MPKRHSFWTSLKNALHGLLYSCKTQRHVQFHLFAAAFVITCAWWLGFNRWEWIVLILTISSVITAEVINTAVETVVDMAQPNFHPLAGLAKDIAAGAVLVTAIQAAAIGVILFGPRVF